MDIYHFELKQPRRFFWIGTALACVFYPIMAEIFFFDHLELEFRGLAISCVAALAGTAVAIRALRWAVVVDFNYITIHQPFRRPLEISTDDISVVKEKRDRIVVYACGKKAFSVDRNVFGFKMFFDMLYEAGKLESIQEKTGFIVRLPKYGMVVSLALAVIFGVIFTWIVITVETVNLLVYIIFFGFIAVFLGNLYVTLRWRMTVDGEALSVRDTIGKEKFYNFEDITKVNAGKGYMTLMIGDVKIGTVSDDFSNFETLLERLTIEKIPFSINGQLVKPGND